MLPPAAGNASPPSCAPRYLSNRRTMRTAKRPPSRGGILHEEHCHLFRWHLEHCRRRVSDQRRQDGADCCSPPTPPASTRLRSTTPASARYRRPSATDQRFARWCLRRRPDEEHRERLPLPRLQLSPGDKIFLFGFSRGAFSARSFCGLLRTCGILHKERVGKVREAIALYQNRDRQARADAAPCVQFRKDNSFASYGAAHTRDISKSPEPLAIEYIGLWDTVGALGVPRGVLLASLFNKKYQFHDLALSRMVKSARHAMSIDESGAPSRPRPGTTSASSMPPPRSRARRSPTSRCGFPATTPRSAAAATYPRHEHHRRQAADRGDRGIGASTLACRFPDRGLPRTL